MNKTRILAIDVGAGTQDILLWETGQPMENNIKLVLPSWTTVLARKVKQATQDGRPIFLTGNLMGGGPVVSALKRHLKADHPVYVTPRAALTIRDNLDQVRERGYTLVEEAPVEENLLTLQTRDVDLEAIAQALVPFEVSLPETVAVAVQDHGECLEGSNRQFRFQLWKEFVQVGGEITRLVYRDIPSCYTRMLAVQQDAPGAILMDTGSAALWGILEDPQAAAHQEEGFTLVNIGNQHVVAVLLKGERILGLFEHHTVLMTPDKLQTLVERLQTGTLNNQEIYDDHGHGAYIHPDYENDFRYVTVTGPQRHLATGLDYHFAAPYGDMMLTGCFGLVAGALREAEGQ